MLKVETGSNFEEEVTSLLAPEDICCVLNDVDVGSGSKIVDVGMMVKKSVDEPPGPLLGGDWGLERLAEVEWPEIFERLAPFDVCAAEDCTVGGTTPVGVPFEEGLE